MQIVPLVPVASQLVNILLGGQNCQIAAYQKSTGFFVDVSVDNALIIGGVIAQNLNRIVRSAYLGFVGDFCFIDTHAPILPDGSQEPSDPVYSGLGTRFFLLYLSASDVALNDADIAAALAAAAGE